MFVWIWYGAELPVEREPYGLTSGVTKVRCDHQKEFFLMK